jgi:RNA polymerase sigma-70 factor (sigma-E family)
MMPCVLACEMEAVTGETAHVREQSGRMVELYARYGPGAARLAYLLTGDRATADDLVQEAFVRVFGRFRDLRDSGAFEWYLRRTVVNLVNSHFRHLRSERDYLRRRRVERPVSMPDIAERDEMWRALLRLPARQRAAIVLRFYEDLSESATADLLRCPVGTVKSLVSRGLDRLRSEVTRDA